LGSEVVIVGGWGGGAPRKRNNSKFTCSALSREVRKGDSPRPDGIHVSAVQGRDFGPDSRGYSVAAEFTKVGDHIVVGKIGCNCGVRILERGVTTPRVFV